MKLRTLGSLRGPLLGGILGMALPACSDPRPLVLVDVGPLPSQPARLRVSLSYDGQPARLPSPIEFDLSRHRGGDIGSFGIHLPVSTNGDLTIGAGAIDSAGCLAALGTITAGPVQSQPRVMLPLAPAPSDISRDLRCSEPEKTPLLVRVTPQVVASRGDDSRILLSGWGFTLSGTDCPLVTLDGVTAQNVLCPSFAELSADLPPGPRRIGRVAVRVLNRSNGRTSTRRDLFGVYASDVVLSPAVAGPVTLSGAPSAPTSALLAADLNRDGRADLVAVSRTGSSLHVLLNSGSGDGATAFPAITQTQIAVGVRPTAVVAGDVSGDGLPDLVVSNSGDGTLSVLQQGSGGPGMPFAVSIHRRAYANLAPESLALLAASDDALADVAVANRLSDDISVFISEAGSLPRKSQRDYAVGRQPTGLVADDINGDGLTDLLMSEGSPESYRVLGQDAARHFVRLTGSSPQGARALQLASADCDGDGHKDLVRLLPAGLVEIWRGDGQGSFAANPQDRFTLPGEATAFVIADLDLDERPDIVALSSSPASLYILRNATRRRPILFESLPTIAAGPSGSAPVALSAGDFDGDGLPDIAVARASDNSIAIFNNRSF